jgi:predicted small lipoprotein YifL
MKSLSRAAIVLVAALALTACGKKSPTSESPASTTNTPNPPKTPEAKGPTPRDKLIGKWERDPVADGVPIYMEFRSDGTTTLKHQQQDGNVQVADGRFTAPDDSNISGEFTVMVNLAKGGGYGFQFAREGDELVMARVSGKFTVKFRKAK